MIELDGLDAYHTCYERFGPSIANALAVAFCRRAVNPQLDWPTDEHTKAANKLLQEKGLIHVDEE